VKFTRIYLAIIMGSFSLSLIISTLAFAQSSQCIQCHTSKEKLQAIAKLIPEKHKSTEAEGSG
jgi:hypothetical protein